MKVSNHTMIFTGAGKAQAEAENIKNGEKQEKQLKKSLYAGSLNEDLFANRIQQKKKEAQKKALKVVGDAWESDRAIDEDILSRRERIADLEKENQKALAEIRDINRMQEECMAQYGIKEDSQEHKELELFQKRSDYMKGKGPKLTKDEWERVFELEMGELTDYQQKMLEWEKQKGHFEGIIDTNKETMLEEYAIIRGIRQERLKHAPMVKAQEQAEDILEAASREIIGMTVEDAKEHIDEEQEKEKEKAEKLEEKREEQEKIIEKQQEKRKEQEELLESMPMEEILDMNQIKNEIQHEVKNIVSEMKLVIEDIKGALVDKSV